MSSKSENDTTPDHSDKNKKSETIYVPIEYLQSAHDEGDKIDLFELIKTVWQGRWLVIKTVIVFIIIVLFVALTSVEEFTSQVRVLPEAQQSRGLGALGGLASQFGISAGAQRADDGIPAALYPDITRSTILLYRLLDYEIFLEGQEAPLTVREYMLAHQKQAPASAVHRYTIRLPFTLRNWLSNRDDEDVTVIPNTLQGHLTGRQLIQMEREEWEIIRNLRERISADALREVGVVSVTVKMQDPLAAAQIADQLVELLSEYITEYRTEKFRRDVQFIEERYEEARIRFEEAQQELARFNDANRGQLSAMARTEEQLLQNNFNLTFNLYNTLAERLEDARIKLQEETPVVNILEPAIVPDRRSEPKRAQLMIIYTILGGIVGVILLFAKQFWEIIKARVFQ
ncbi:MAG: hypothetical protein JJU37_16975 [Balneolaceae bacterium]|nr:hypothetical protein [Balneolaceae bacterium]